MKRSLVTLACAMAAVVAVSVAPVNPKVVPFGVDVVSAATGEAPAKTTTKPTTTTTTVKITATLKEGSNGDQVKTLQTALKAKGYKVTVDGKFGSGTTAAVKDFQKKSGLKVTGIVDATTVAKLFPAPVAPAVTPAPTTPAVPTTPTVPDVVATASVTDDAAVFAKSIGTEGKWIICTTKDLTTDKQLVLEGEFKNGKKNPDGTDQIQRKIGLYTQDDKHVVTGRFTLTAPKLTIKSPNARIQSGTFKGDLYVSADNFTLVDTVIEGNLYFTTQSAKDTFVNDRSSVTGETALYQIDATTTASVTDNHSTFQNAISSTGNWIICTTKDMVFNKELVLDGTFKNGKKNADGTDQIQRKIGIYSQDDKHVVTRRFTLTAPKLTIKSPNARIQGGTFKGDVYVSALNFQLVDAKVDGNIYFTNQQAFDTFTMDAKSSFTGNKTIKLN